MSITIASPIARAVASAVAAMIAGRIARSDTASVARSGLQPERDRALVPAARHRRERVGDQRRHDRRDHHRQDHDRDQQARARQLDHVDRPTASAPS